jgi:aarF domain-containing kinase
VNNINFISDNASQFTSLINDIADIVRSSGVSASLTRSAQAFRAVNTLSQEFFRKPETFREANGTISTPRVVRRLFEELGATYIKLGQFIASSPTLFPPEYVR